MNETRNEITNKAFKALEWISLIMLTIGVGYFVKDVWHQFSSCATGVTVKSEIVEDYELPTITFYFTPGAKESALKRYNISFNQFRGFDKIPSEVHYPQFYNDVKYKIGTDFNISLWHGIGVKLITEGNIIEEISTFYFGVCYKFTSEAKIKPFIPFVIMINFDKVLEESNDIPKKIDIYYTSEQNSYGIITGIWSEGKVFKKSINPKDNVGITVEPYKYKKLGLKIKCNQDPNYNQMKCLSKL